MVEHVAVLPRNHLRVARYEHTYTGEIFNPLGVRSKRYRYLYQVHRPEPIKIRPETVSKIIPAFRVGKRDSVNTHRYNFCLIQRSLRMTPAMAAGITDHIWHLKDIIS